MLKASVPDAAELIGRACELRPVIAARALECERLGRLPDESFADFRDAGFFRILQPKRFGGYEHDIYTLLQVTREIGRSGCCSSAWVLAILAIHNFYLGYFPPKAQEDIWGEDEDTQTCTPFVPAGKVTKVTGGIEIRDGRWPFASGCDHSRFALVGVLVPDEAGGPPEYFQCVVPRGDFAIDHTSWDVVALKGTGSKDITISECFVPSHRMFSLTKVAQDIAPGRQINPGPLYRQPFFAASVCSLIAPAWGAAQAALDAFEERMKSRVMVFGGGNQGEKSTALLRLTEAAAEIDAAGLLLKRNCDTFRDLAVAGQPTTKSLRARALFEGAYATTLLTRAVERLFVASGGSALHEGSVIQRCWRDVHAVNSHAGMNLDNMGELYGQIRLGKDIEHGLI
ncbi:MAG: flavin-dependent monooxygenase [Immundisolibacter sp.]